MIRYFQYNPNYQYNLSYQPIFDNASLGSIGGNLRQGELATYTASFIITQQAIDAGGVSNTVTVIASSPGKTNDIFDISDDGDDTDGNTQNDPTITRITTITPSSSIVLTKAASISDTNAARIAKATNIASFTYATRIAL